MTEEGAYTVLAPDTEVVTELTRKKSRFLTIMQRVNTSGEAQEAVDRIRREHRGARHHCSAWSIGHQRRTQRANDDGEPSGTAGAPMLDAITKAEMSTGMQDLSDVCVVVVRWFGGTLLGAGGLVSAYSDSVAGVLEQARTEDLFRVRQRMRGFSVRAPLTQAGRWEHELRAAQITVRGTDYTSESDRAVLDVVVPEGQRSLSELASLVASLSGGEAELHPGACTWIDRPAGP